MQDLYNEKNNYMRAEYPELSPEEYYNMMFPPGSFQQQNVEKKNLKANGLLQFTTEGGPKDPRTRIIFEGHEVLKQCVAKKGEFKSTSFAIVSGCSYIGKSRCSDNARIVYAIIIDVDDVGRKELENLLYACQEKIAPMPTTINISGNGVHVVYIFEQPVELTLRTKKKLEEAKRLLTELLWNPITSKKKRREYQSIVQGYRMVGSLTKRKHICRAFRVGPKIGYYSLLDFLGILDDTSPTLDEAKEQWPEWYQKRIIERQPRGHIQMGRAMYDKFLAAVKKGAVTGHRYHCILCLAAIAQKCNLPEEELRKDAYSLLPLFESRTVSADNHFTKHDIEDALSATESNDYSHMSVKKIELLSGVDYPRRKKSDRKQGRPNKASVVADYLRTHPGVSVTDIARECGVARGTVYKYLNQQKNSSVTT